MALKIDLAELDNGKRHWLHPSVRYAHIIERVREKNRNLHLERQRQLREAAKKVDAMVKK